MMRIINIKHNKTSVVLPCKLLKSNLASEKTKKMSSKIISTIGAIFILILNSMFHNWPLLTYICLRSVEYRNVIFSRLIRNDQYNLPTVASSSPAAPKMLDDVAFRMPE
jgi:hypothetical protein